MCEQYVNIQTGETLDMERVSKLKDNAMLKVNPHLWVEWDFKANEGEFDAWKMTKGSDKKAQWMCKDCYEPFSQKISNRTKCQGCPSCGKKRSGDKVVKGVNDIHTTNEYLSKRLANYEDGFKYKQFSAKRVDFKCLDCGEIIKNKQICNIANRGLFCPICSDNISYPEKVMYNLLKVLNIDFVKELSKSTFKWVENKRYDYYIPSLNCIVEVHGCQHYVKQKRGRTLEQERENDRTKRELALLNGISYYVELDCRESNINYIKESILNSELSKLLDISNVDWTDLGVQSEKSLKIKVCNLWNDGLAVIEIANTMTLHKKVISKYLIQGKEMGLCDYTEEEARKRGDNYGKREIRAVRDKLIKQVSKLWNDGLSPMEIVEELKKGNLTIRKYLKEGKEKGLCDYNEEEARSRSQIKRRQNEHKIK